eukprot:824388-Prymnesium_polylepis.1
MRLGRGLCDVEGAARALLGGGARAPGGDAARACLWPRRALRRAGAAAAGEAMRNFAAPCRRRR